MFQRVMVHIVLLAGLAGVLTGIQATWADTSSAATIAEDHAARMPVDELEPLSLVQADSRNKPAEHPERTTRVEERTVTTEEEHPIVDLIREHQSQDAYNSLEDGQPGHPCELELEFKFGWQTASEKHDVFPFEGEIEYTLGGSPFLENTQLILGMPIDMGIGGVKGNFDLNFGWLQRWVKEDGAMPTLSTLSEIRVPSGYHSSGCVDATLTGIVAKELGCGTAYFNAFAKSVNSDNEEDARHFQWGGRAGYKYRINECFALIGDYVHQCSEEVGHGNSNLLEVSGEYHATDHLTVGPGIVIGLDDNEETPNFGAGVLVKYSF